jgi:acyl-CoA thioester hydrolase
VNARKRPTPHSWPAPASPSQDVALHLRPRRGRYPTRVLYQDTDQARIVHHASYFRYLEAARLELWREHGFDYARFERETGLGLPVAEARLRYRSAARFDDLLVVETWARGASRASIWLDANVSRQGVVLLEASVRIACVSLAEGTIRRIPTELLDACLEIGHGL